MKLHTTTFARIGAAGLLALLAACSSPPKSADLALDRSRIYIIRDASVPSPTPVYVSLNGVNKSTLEAGHHYMLEVPALEFYDIGVHAANEERLRLRTQSAEQHYFRAKVADSAAGTQVRLEPMSPAEAALSLAHSKAAP